MEQNTLKQSNERSNLDRSEFLKLLQLIGGTVIILPFLDACQKIDLPPTVEPAATGKMNTPEVSPTMTSEPVAVTEAYPMEMKPTTTTTPSPTPGKNSTTRVALVKTEDRAEGVRRTIDLLGSNPIAGKDVFLKPNFNSADPAPGSTHPEVLQALVLKLREMGSGPITVGDRSGMGDTREVMYKLGIFKLAEELVFDTLVLDELGAGDWIRVNPPGSHWKQGFLFAKPCLESGALVQACCLKTHRYGGHFTLSLKNSVGMAAKVVPGEGYNYMDELHSSPDQRMMIAEINSAYQPALVLLDGVEAFTSGGPDKGKLVRPNVMLAGNDRVAIDAVGVAILRYFGTTPEVANGPIFQLEQIARAVELGLGVSSANQIELVTDDRESEAFATQIYEKFLSALQ
jgi:uncharacterized protein (DUF362 family)